MSDAQAKACDNACKMHVKGTTERLQKEPTGAREMLLAICTAMCWQQQSTHPHGLLVPNCMSRTSGRKSTSRQKAAAEQLAGKNQVVEGIDWQAIDLITDASPLPISEPRVRREKRLLAASAPSYRSRFEPCTNHLNLWKQEQSRNLFPRFQIKNPVPPASPMPPL